MNGCLQSPAAHSITDAILVQVATAVPVVDFSGRYPRKKVEGETSGAADDENDSPTTKKTK
jgi:hypothetical protein